MDWTDVIRFWFEETAPMQWFKKDEAFDETIRERFGRVYEKAALGETSGWRGSARGRLAEIIVLDQFPRNMFRGTAQAFATDDLALELSQQAIAQGLDTELTLKERHFLYMPLMHSESADVHERAVELFESLGNPDALKYEMMHKDIIDRFGRYPHRNEALGRSSTPEELEFVLTHPGF